MILSEALYYIAHNSGKISTAMSDEDELIESIKNKTSIGFINSYRFLNALNLCMELVEKIWTLSIRYNIVDKKTLDANFYRVLELKKQLTS